MSTRAIKPFDVIVVPFPYSDNQQKTKRRPAVVISKDNAFHARAGKVVIAMITSASDPWPHDVRIKDIHKAGLHVDCSIRMKIFTIEQRFILESIGTLGAADRKSVKSSLGKLLVS